MSKFNIGDKVISKGYPHLGEEVGIVVGIDIGAENGEGKYLVKFDSLDISEGWTYRCFSDISLLIIEPYDGYAIWLDDLEKVENESEEVCMNEFNIGDKVISNDSCYSGKEIGTIVGIDPREDAKGGKYLVEFNSLDASERYATWLNDVIKVEDKHEDECEEECKEDKHEEDIKIEFDKIREQKKEVIKSISEKVLEMTLEIKEMEHEIEKIKKEWHL